MRNGKRLRILTLWVVGLLAVATMAGCRSTRTATPTPTEQPSEYSMMRFTGTVDGMSIDGQVRREHGKVIWVSVSKLIELGRAMATQDSVWLRVPLMDRYQQGDYRDLERMAKMKITFADLEAILESDDAERQIAELGKRFGAEVKVRITKRERTGKLSFPF